MDRRHLASTGINVSLSFHKGVTFMPARRQRSIGYESPCHKLFAVIKSPPKIMKKLSKVIMMTSILSAVVSISASSGCQADALNKNSRLSIVLPQAATIAEQTAAKELDTYLEKATGGEFTVLQENAAGLTKPSIYVGNTQFAQQSGLGQSAFATEEWAVKTQAGNLILNGEGTRGTLYAVYNFLEKNAGVRWWNPWEELVPQNQEIDITALDLRGKPAFSYRDIYTTHGEDGGRFAIRNRLNRDGDAPIEAPYGGSNDYGPPYHVHTFYKILPPSKYYAEHPDWYIVHGKDEPNWSNSQLAISNPEMRKEFLKQLQGIIRTSRQIALEKQLPPPVVYSVSQEDNDLPFSNNEADRQFVAQNGGAESALLIDFVNYLADNVKDEFPDIYIDTLAYFVAEKAPTKITVRDNVVVRLCDTQSNMFETINAKRNTPLRENILAWAKICKNLRIWDYNISITHPQLPVPTLHTYGPDFQFFLNNNVQGVFIEFQQTLFADLRDLKLWLMCKQLEDPSLDQEKLLVEFTDGFYGPAGVHIRRYLKLLEAKVVAEKSDIASTFNDLWEFKYLDFEFLNAADKVFQEASAAVADDATFARRVNHARSTVDYAILAFYPRNAQQWVDAGNSLQNIPLNRDTVAGRYLNSMYQQIELRFAGSEAGINGNKHHTYVRLQELIAGSVLISTPARFKDTPADRLTVFDARDMRNYQKIAKVTSDEEAESGMASRFVVTAEEAEKYRLPMVWGLYDAEKSKGVLENHIKTEDVPGPGYHWYKLGEAELTKRRYMHFTWSWNMQLDLLAAFQKDKPNAKYEIWANIKFEGELFPHGTAQKENAIFVERIVVVEK